MTSEPNIPKSHEYRYGSSRGRAWRPKRKLTLQVSAVIRSRRPSFSTVFTEGVCIGCSWIMERFQPCAGSSRRARYCLQAGVVTTTTRTGSILSMRYTRSSRQVLLASKHMIHPESVNISLVGRSRKRALGNILCCHITKVPCSWPREETQQWPRLKQQSHAQPQRFDLIPALRSYARPIFRVNAQASPSYQTYTCRSVCCRSLNASKLCPLACKHVSCLHQITSNSAAIPAANRHMTICHITHDKTCINIQAQDMAEYLGIDAESESDLLDIARMAVAAPTPPDWQQINRPDGSGMFRSINMLQLASHWMMFCMLLACLPSVPLALAICVFCTCRPCLTPLQSTTPFLQKANHTSTPASSHLAFQ